MVSDNTSWNRLGGSTAIPHASALGIVAACLEIQVRVVHPCVSAININAKYYYVCIIVSKVVVISWGSFLMCLSRLITLAICDVTFVTSSPWTFPIALLQLLQCLRTTDSS
jgi:uncharacterized membrane protein